MRSFLQPSLRRAATRRERQADIWLAASLLVTAIISTALGAVAGIYGEATSTNLTAALLYALGITAPIAVRRLAPEATAVIVSIVFFVGVSARIPELYVGNVTLFIVIYTVGAWVEDRRRAALVRIGIIIAMAVWLLTISYLAALKPDNADASGAAFSPYIAMILIQILVNAAFFGGAYYFGNRAYAAAAESERVSTYVDELERERSLSAQQAVSLERVRIARELHDVVAHHVSAMGVQAGAARTVLARDPDAAARALVQVEDAARNALSELRQLLSTLRTGDGAEPAGSTLRLAGLDELVAHAGAHGLPTTLTVVGEPFPVPELAQLNLYRIAQEALTNARRHGGPDARADVRLRYENTDGERAVEVEIANDGRVPARMHGGLGLVGMRERASASGGTLLAEPRPRGGFVVRVRLPVLLPAEAPVEVPA